MSQPYKTHLCTFMGRQNNVKTLIQYVDRALQIDAVDNYWMIDMTRCVEDHEYIYEQQQKLDSKYPGRVHVYNRDKRAQELKDPQAIKDGIGGWKTFYEFLNRFTDNDVIAKCDDDTLYFDIETLKAAFELRWNNKQPYLMHANCINNGVTAYHQHKKGIWKTKETDVYPACGLTGPLFSFPEIACEHHKIFTNDLIKSPNNINKYKLEQNILFQNRVSINFIFMLGSDRKSLSTIDLQDEYETSCKKPQAEDRPNCIIGDFTAAHHTYGVQEPVMEELDTQQCYEKLADVLAKKNDYEHKSITDTVNRTVTLGDKPDEYVAKLPYNKNTKIIQHVPTGMYISITGNKQEKIRFDKDKNKIPTGDYMLQNQLCAEESESNAALMDIELNKPTLLEFTNSNKLIRTGGSRKEIQEKYKPEKDFYPGHMIAKFFQGGYKTELANFIKQPSGNYRIQSNTHKDYYLRAMVNKKTSRLNLRWEKNSEDEFNVISFADRVHDVDTIRVYRCKDNLMNDGTYYESITNNQRFYKAREYYWMIDHYIWELVPSGKNVHVKLVADDLEDLYLTVSNDTLTVTSKSHEWNLVGNKKINSGQTTVHIK